MIITFKQINSTAKISVSGRLDVLGSAEFRREINDLPSITKKIIFDFRDVDYVSSAGLREILICCKKFPGTQIENMRREVYDTFLMTSFDKFISITLAGDTAVRKFSVDEGLSFEKFLRNKTVHNGDKVAIVDGGKSYTWQEINRCSSVIADDLSALGVKIGSHVAICGANSINWLLTFFAIQKLGAIAVLVNFNLCAKEISALINYADVTHFCYGEMTAAIEDVNNPCKFYSIRNEIDFKVRNTLKNKLNVAINSDNPSVMIFTSGTTGKLKGVILSAYNILNAAQINSEDQTLRSDDKSCIILPFFHVFGLIAGLFANFIAGVTIYLPEKIRSNNTLELIYRERCTIFHSVPTMLIAMINNKNFSADKVASLRCTIISGARATEAQIKNFQQHMPNNHFMSSYGLSEMAPVSITDYDDSIEKTLKTVGKPVKNIKIKIKSPDSDGTGEILIQGFNLMLGYYKLGLDEQPIDAEGWLHTGDLGKLYADGYLNLTGRIKEMIIRGGENIYPAEVEAVISEDENISDVKVFGLPHNFFGEIVCACVKIKKLPFDEEKLRDELKERLAKFKIPEYFLVYDEFPLLGSGKTDVVSLKKSALERILSA